MIWFLILISLLIAPVNTSADTFQCDNFTCLADAPQTYLGASGQCPKVNGTETGLEFGVCGGVSSLSKSFVITGATTASDFGNVWRAPANLTLTAIHCAAIGGTNVVGQLQECDSAGANCADVDSDMTCTAGANVNDDGSLTNPSIDSTDYIGVKTTSVSGTNSRITWTFEYTEA